MFSLDSHRPEFFITLTKKPRSRVGYTSAPQMDEIASNLETARGENGFFGTSRLCGAEMEFARGQIQLPVIIETISSDRIFSETSTCPESPLPAHLENWGSARSGSRQDFRFSATDETLCEFRYPKKVLSAPDEDNSLEFMRSRLEILPVIVETSEPGYHAGQKVTHSYWRSNR